MPILSLSHRCYEVLAVESFCPTPSALLSGSPHCSGADRAAGPSGCAERCSLSLSQGAPLGAVRPSRGHGAPPSAGCGGGRGRGVASRRDSASGHGCPLPPEPLQAEGKENGARFPSAVLSFSLGCQIIFLHISVTVTRERANVLCSSVLLIDLTRSIALLPGLMITESLSACA